MPTLLLLGLLFLGIFVMVVLPIVVLVVIGVIAWRLHGLLAPILKLRPQLVQALRSSAKAMDIAASTLAPLGEVLKQSGNRVEELAEPLSTVEIRVPTFDTAGIPDALKDLGVDSDLRFVKGVSWEDKQPLSDVEKAVDKAADTLKKSGDGAVTLSRDLRTSAEILNQLATVVETS